MEDIGIQDLEIPGSGAGGDPHHSPVQVKVDPDLEIDIKDGFQEIPDLGAQQDPPPSHLKEDPDRDIKDESRATPGQGTRRVVKTDSSDKEASGPSGQKNKVSGSTEHSQGAKKKKKSPTKTGCRDAAEESTDHKDAAEQLTGRDSTVKKESTGTPAVQRRTKKRIVHLGSGSMSRGPPSRKWKRE